MMKEIFLWSEFFYFAFPLVGENYWWWELVDQLLLGSTEWRKDLLKEMRGTFLYTALFSLFKEVVYN